MMPRMLAVAVMAAALVCGAEETAVNVFEVDNFGAVAGSRDDAGPAVRAAVKAAIAAGPGAEVLFGPGVYILADEESNKTGVLVSQADGLTIRGVSSKTEILVTNPRIGVFGLTACKNTWVRGLTVDYNPPPFTQGTVVSVEPNAGHFDYALQDDFPSLAEPWFAECAEPYGKWGMIFDRNERRLKTGAPDFIFMRRWEHIEGNVWRMFPREGEAGKLCAMDPGDPFVYMARGGRAIISFHACSDSGVEDITIHAAPGLAMALVANERVTVRNVRILHRPGTQRLLTLDADGVHCQQNRVGPIIENCLFEGMADDSINIYCPPNDVLEVVSSTELLTGAKTHVLPGDELLVFDPRAGRVLGTAKAASATRESGTWRLVLSEAIEGITAGKDHTDADSLFNLSASGEGFIIRNNTFRLHRRHAIYLRGGPGLVEGNLIDRTAGLGIVLSNEPDWPEGPLPRDVIVRNNTVKGVGYARHYADSIRGAGICVNALRLGQELAEDMAARDITIADNTIIDPPGSGVFVGSATGVTVSNTKVVYNGAPRGHEHAAPVLITHAKDVTVDGVEVESPGAWDGEAVRVLDPETSEVTVVTN